MRKIKNEFRYLFSYKYNSIYVRTLLTFVLILLVVIFAIEGVVFSRSSSIISDKVKNTNQQNLRHIKQGIDFSMEKIEKISYSMVNDSHLQKEYDALSTDERFYMMQHFFSQFFFEDYIESIYIYYEDSQKVITTDDGIIDVHLLENLDWLLFYNDKRPLGYRTEVFTSKSNDDCITFMRGFPYGAMNELGTVIININKDRFFNSLDNGDDQNEEIFVLNDKGELLYGNNASYENFKTNDDFTKGLEQKKNHVSIKIGGEKTQVALAYSDARNWIYIKAQDVSLLNKEIEENFKYINLITVISLLLGIVLSFIRMNKLYRPIMDLIEIAEKNQDAMDENKERNIRNEIELLKHLLEKIIISREDLKNFYVKSQNAVLQKSLLDLCYGDVDNEESILQYLKDADFPVAGRNFVAMVIQFEKDNDSLTSSIKRDIISDNTSIHYDLIITCMQQDKIVCLVSLKSDFDSKIYEIAAEIKNVIKYEFDAECSIGIGNAYQGLMQFQLSFNEALDALKYKGFLENNSIIHINSFIGKSYDNKYYYSISKEEELIDAIKQIDKISALKIIDEVYKSILQSTNEIKMVSLLLWQLTNGIVRCITSMGFLYTDIMGTTFYQDITEYNNIDSPDVMLEFVKNKAAIVIDHLNEKRNYHNENVIKKIKDYIEEHLDEDLSLEIFASMTMLSATYISSIFKAISGEGLRDYIIRVRMEKAKELLSNSDKNIELISKCVGYENVRSFTRTFKSFCGLTPGEYRKNPRI
ncbi:MAG: helix-turn-helix domain-containing protein [Clostridia bacterium]|nr:helix-turn-helix domain-containing protein [Clostridia bacterium]